MKRLLKFLLFLVLGLIIVMILVPIFFKDELIEAVKTEINKNLNAKVDFADADVSFLSSFPKINLQLENLEVVGVNEFEGEKLMSTKNVFLSTDWKSLFKSSEGINIYDINVDEPFLNIIVNEKGLANYDISKSTSTETTSESSGFFGNIESYKITDATLNYSDQVSSMYVSVEDLDHEGKGNFKDIEFDLETMTSIEKLSFKSEGINYLTKAKLKADIDLALDLDNQTYTFKENLISLNDLDLSFVGIVKLLNEGFDLDLSFKAPNNSVASLVSIIPNAYTADYKDIQSQGVGTIAGTVKGIFNSEKSVYPQFNIKVDLVDGVIKYPDLPFPVKDILLDLQVNSQKKDLSDLAVNIPVFNFNLEGDKVNGNLKINNALGNADIKGFLKGKLDLSKLAKAYPMEEYKLKSGILESDITLNSNKNSILNQDYKNIGFDGSFNCSNLDVETQDIVVKIDKIDSKLNPKNVDLSVVNANIGNSDFNGTFKIVDPLLYITEEGNANVVINLKSKVLDVDQFMKMSATEETSVMDTISNEIPFQNIKLDGRYSAEAIKYENYDLKKLDGQFIYDNDNLNLINSSAQLDGKYMSIKGNLNKPMAYMFNEETLTGEIYLNAKEINANKYINENAEESSIEEIIPVPKSIKLQIHPTIDKLIYDTYTLINTSGTIDIADGVAALRGGKTKLFNGNVNFEGTYNTSESSNPLFDFKYDMSDINFTKLFEESESFRLLAPIAKYIDGIFNSNLIISGPIGKDMMPDLTKLTASGFMETVQGKVNGFAPLSKLGNALGIDALKTWEIKDSKNWFEIKDGRVILKDHDYDFEDMTFTVGGNHGIDQSIDYRIKAIIPRSKLKEANLGKTLEMGMNRIEQEATSRGVNISLGENVFMDIYLTGTLLSPKVKIVPVGSGGKTLTDVVKDQFDKQTGILKDTIQKEINKKTDELKDTISKVVNSRVDTVKSQVKKEVDKQTDAMKDKLKEQMKEKLDSTVSKTVIDTIGNVLGDKVGDVVGEQVEIDSLKEKLKGWNPFKKKKN